MSLAKDLEPQEGEQQPTIATMSPEDLPKLKKKQAASRLTKETIGTENGSAIAIFSS